MAILFDSLTGAKSTGGTWTKISGPLLPAAPGTYNGDVDFDSAEKGTHIYQYETESTTITGCSDLSTVTVEVGEGFPMVNDECTGAIIITPPFGSGPTLPTLSYAITDQWLGCEAGFSSIPTYCQLDPATLDAEYLWVPTGVDCDSWYKLTLPGYMVSDYNLTVTVSSAAYPVDGLQSPKLELFTSGILADCVDELDTICHSSAGIGNTVSCTVTISGGTAYFLWIRVGAKNLEGGKFSITIAT